MKLSLNNKLTYVYRSKPFLNSTKKKKKKVKTTKQKCLSFPCKGGISYINQSIKKIFAFIFLLFFNFSYWLLFIWNQLVKWKMILFWRWLIRFLTILYHINFDNRRNWGFCYQKNLLRNKKLYISQHQMVIICFLLTERICIKKVHEYFWIHNLTIKPNKTKRHLNELQHRTNWL